MNLDTQIDLKLAAELSETSLANIQILNPGFNRFATAPEGPHRLILPVANSNIFMNNIINLDYNQFVNFKKYNIKSGDTLIGVAKKFGTTVDTLKNLNHLANNRIKLHSDLIIPVSATA